MVVVFNYSNPPPHPISFLLPPSITLVICPFNFINKIVQNFSQFDFVDIIIHS